MIDNRLRDLAYRELERVEDEQALQLRAPDSEQPRYPTIAQDGRRPSVSPIEQERATRWSS
jgi:hypothetical protein